MEMADWLDILDEDDEAESCLSREACAEDLVSDEPVVCLYCLLRDLGEEDDV
jgi:hypothetical protein